MRYALFVLLQALLSGCYFSGSGSEVPTAHIMGVVNDSEVTIFATIHVGEREESVGGVSPGSSKTIGVASYREAPKIIIEYAIDDQSGTIPPMRRREISISNYEELSKAKKLLRFSHDQTWSLIPYNH